MRKPKSELPVMPGMGRPDVAGMLQRRMDARLQPGQAQKGTDGLALFGDRQLDLAERKDTLRGRYRFTLTCPACKKVSELVTEPGDECLAVNCGDCLMERTEVVEMKVTGLEVLK